MPIETLADFEKSAKSFLVIASDGNWLLEDLSAHHLQYQKLQIDTRAGAIGGFTPLAHGMPSFYTAHLEAEKTIQVTTSSDTGEER
jgi:uncharacterized SAM-binding protein YcdF (DUF218 family)